MVTVHMHEEANEVDEASFTYLLLAKQMIQQDMTAAMYCLGISREAAELVAELTPAQLLKLPGELSGFQNMGNTASLP